MFDICLDDPCFSVCLAPCYNLLHVRSHPSSAQPSISLAYNVSILLVTSCLLSLFYFRCSTTIVITTTTTIVSQLLLIPLCKQVLISGAVELTTQLSKLVRILWLPKCRINNWCYLAREYYLDPLQLRVINYYFLAPLLGIIALFTCLLEVSCLLH